MELIWISLGIGYFFGSFLTAAAVAYICTGKSIREIGSGNPGMANVMSNIGKKQGFLVLGGDILKMILAFLLAWELTGKGDSGQVILWTGFGGVLGHNFPLWRKFKGGKGVAVTCTWLIIFMPLWGTLSCLVGGVVTLVTGYLPLGAMVISILAVPFAFWQKGVMAGILMLLAALLMFTRHYRGLRRVIQGKEPKKFRKRE